MSVPPLLTVDDQPITLHQALGYLQSSGNLGPFVGQIVRQYVIERELAIREDLQISPAVIEQAIINFRLDQQLSDPEKFQQWLVGSGMTYESFHQQIARGFQLERLMAEVTEAKLQDFFIENKIHLDRVVLSRMIVDNQELSEELKSQVVEEGARFEQLIQEYSLADDRIMNGMMGPISRGQLPDGLRAAIDSANPGDLIGPFEIEKRWCLFRVEQFLPASLSDEALKQSLQNELFEAWIAEKIQSLQVQLQPSE